MRLTSESASPDAYYLPSPDEFRGPEPLFPETEDMAGLPLYAEQLHDALEGVLECSKAKSRYRNRKRSTSKNAPKSTDPKKIYDGLVGGQYYINGEAVSAEHYRDFTSRKNQGWKPKGKK